MNRFQTLSIALSCGCVLALTSASYPAAQSASIPLSRDPLKRTSRSQDSPDFNRDGFADLAVGHPLEDLDGSTVLAGAVSVIYGTPSGLSPLRRQRWTKETLGYTAETGDEFGASLATGDFNGDGFGDLAIGAPADDANGVRYSGAVYIMYGSTSGLTSAGNQQWSQATAGVPGSPGVLDQFGSSLAAGNFGRTRADDLAIGVIGETVGSAASAGAVNVLYGGQPGLSSQNSQLWSQASAGVAGTAEDTDQFGFAVAAGRIRGTAYDDLAIGVPFEDVGRVQDGGALHLLWGGSGGLQSVGSKAWRQSRALAGGSGEAGDRFGLSLASGHFSGRVNADLAVGVPYEDVGRRRDAGAVTILRGVNSGLSSQGRKTYTQGSAGIAGRLEAGDRFGLALASGNLGNNYGSRAYDDLAIGAPYEDGPAKDSGAVTVVYGTVNGISTRRSDHLTQATPGLPGRRGAGDNFGLSIAIGDFGANRDNRRFDDLAIGIPQETVAGVRAGASVVVPGASAGVDNTRTRFWSQRELAQQLNAGSRFGAALTTSS